MTGESFVKRNGDAAENQRPSLDEAMQVVAEPRAAGARRLRSRAADRFRDRQVARRRDLDVRGVAGDDAYGMPGLFGQRGFVRRVARDCQRVAKDVASKALRRLRKKDGPSIQRR